METIGGSDSTGTVKTANSLSMAERLSRGRGLLQRAAGLKEGWGWGVNQGEIHLTLAAVDLALFATLTLQSDSTDPSSGPGSSKDGDRAEEMLSEAAEALTFSRERQVAEGQHAGWYQEVSMLLGSVQSYRESGVDADAAFVALDDDEPESLEGGALSLGCAAMLPRESPQRELYSRHQRGWCLL